MPADAAETLKRHDQSKIGSVRQRKTWEEVEMVNPMRLNAAPGPRIDPKIFEPIAGQKITAADYAANRKRRPVIDANVQTELDCPMPDDSEL